MVMRRGLAPSVGSQLDQPQGPGNTSVGSYRQACRQHTCFREREDLAVEEAEALVERRVDLNELKLDALQGLRVVASPLRDYSIDLGFEYWGGEEVSGVELRLTRLETLMKEEQEGHAQYKDVITNQLEHAARLQRTHETILSSHTSRIIWC